MGVVNGSIGVLSSKVRLEEERLAPSPKIISSRSSIEKLLKSLKPDERRM